MKSIAVLSAFLAIWLGASAITCEAAEGSIDVAKIVDKPEAESLLGEPVKTPRPRNVNGSDGYYSKCTYYSASSRKSLVVRLHQPNGETVDATKQFETLIGNHEVKTIKDLGDRAAVIRGSPDNGMPDNVVMLYVVKGNTLLTLGIGGIDNEALAIEKVRFAARKILLRL